MRSSRRAFTLVELLVVIGMVVVVCSLVIPAARAKEDDDNLAKCTRTLKTIMASSSMYAVDKKEFLPSGTNSPWVKGELIGSSAYMSTVYKPGHFVGVGQLMAGDYLEEKQEAIACPQTARREDKGYNTNTTCPLLSYGADPTDASLVRGLSRDSGANYYRNLVKTEAQTAYYSTYGVRGPALKLSAIKKKVGKDEITLKPALAAWFLDYEAANQKLVKEVREQGKKVITAWGRVHPAGINTAYADGHVQMFADEDREKIYAFGEVCNYGTAMAVEYFDLDSK